MIVAAIFVRICCLPNRLGERSTSASPVLHLTRTKCAAHFYGSSYVDVLTLDWRLPIFRSKILDSFCDHQLVSVLGVVVSADVPSFTGCSVCGGISIRKTAERHIAQHLAGLSIFKYFCRLEDLP